MPDYLRMRDKFYEVEEAYRGCPELTFHAGFYAGQMEKVMSGACKFAMFRPAEGDPLMPQAICEIADTYGLVVHKLPDVPEYWCCLKENENDFYCLEEMEPDSPSWHRQRGRMCGIAKIDEQYHLRTGGEHE